MAPGAWLGAPMPGGGKPAMSKVKVARELHAWRDYLPAVFWGLLVVGVAVAVPICTKLL